jgi:HSF-type DNA-binding
MLDAMDRTGDKSVVCWQPHGRAFMVHKPKEFVQKVMLHFFNQTKYASFQRQLNLYGFSRLTHGPDKGAYYHGCFVRGERNLCRGMIRQKIKGTKVRRSLAPDEEPNFYSAHYNNNKVVPFHAMANGDKAASNDITQQAPQVTPDQSPRTLIIRPHGASSSESLVSLMPSIPVSLSSTKSVHDSPNAKRMLTSEVNALRMPRTVSPHQALSKMYRVHSVPASQPPSAIKGGDLLFFEGQPFRYLEHLDEVPPPLAFQAKGLPTGPAPSPTPSVQRDSQSAFHEVITKIVRSDPQSFHRNERPRNVCSV